MEVFSFGRITRMRTLVVSILSLANAALLAADARSDGIEAERLLRELPRQAVLRASRDLVVGGEFPDGARERASAQQLAEAERAIAKAKEIVPKLRKLLVVGRSVFDYPGLLARGEITWSALSYDLYIGVYLRPNQGRGPYDFRVTFDAKGVILSVEDVVWKH